jgi:hypothetical protein
VSFIALSFLVLGALGGATMRDGPGIHRQRLNAHACVYACGYGGWAQEGPSLSCQNDDPIIGWGLG